MGHPQKDIKEYQLVSTIKIQLGVLPLLVYYKADLFIISLKINLFSPWYSHSWKIAELALNNNHSLTITEIKKLNNHVGRRGRDGMVVRFTFTNAFNAFNY